MHTDSAGLLHPDVSVDIASGLMTRNELRGRYVLWLFATDLQRSLLDQFNAVFLHLREELDNRHDV